MQSYMDAMALLLVLRCTSFFSDLNQKGIHAPKCVVQHIDAHPGVVTNSHQLTIPEVRQDSQNLVQLHLSN